MRVRWTAKARSDLVRLHEFLAPVNPRAAARVVQLLRAAPTRLRDRSRIGPRLVEFSPRELRRLFVDNYEVSNEVRDDTVNVPALWHTREGR